MRIRLSQLRQIIAEAVAAHAVDAHAVVLGQRRHAKGDWTEEQWVKYNKEYNAAKDKAAEVAHAARKPVPKNVVDHVILNYYDKVDGPEKWYPMLMQTAVEELLTKFGYKTPGKEHVDFEDLDYVKSVLRADPRFWTRFTG